MVRVPLKGANDLTRCHIQQVYFSILEAGERSFSIRTECGDPQTNESIETANDLSGCHIPQHK